MPRSDLSAGYWRPSEGQPGLPCGHIGSHGHAIFLWLQAEDNGQACAVWMSFSSVRVQMLRRCCDRCFWSAGSDAKAMQYACMCICTACRPDAGAADAQTAVPSYRAT